MRGHYEIFEYLYFPADDPRVAILPKIPQPNNRVEAAAVAVDSNGSRFHFKKNVSLF